MISSVGLERLLDRQEVTGSNPVSPTNKAPKVSDLKGFSFSVNQALVSFADFAPTILSLARVDIEKSKMQPMEGKNWKDFFDDNFDQEKSVHRSFVLIGKERHDIGRENDGGYPVRGIVTKELAYTINYEPNRWPAGNPETGYLNTDGSPTKSEILKRNRNKDTLYWHWAFGKRPPEELYDLKADPYCMNNLAEVASFATVKNE